MSNVSCQMDHTLIIRTRNRPYWVARALHSYARLNYTGLLLIDDDSEPECFDAISKLVTRYSSELNIRHQAGAGNSMKRRVDRVRVSTIFTLKNITTKYYEQGKIREFIKLKGGSIQQPQQPQQPQPQP